VTDINNSSNDNTVIIFVNSTREVLPCRICGQATRGHGVGRTLRMRHLSLLGKETYIEIKPRRGRCEKCDNGPTTTERLDWYELNSKMTKPYEQY